MAEEDCSSNQFECFSDIIHWPPYPVLWSKDPAKVWRNFLSHKKSVIPIWDKLYHIAVMRFIYSIFLCLAFSETSIHGPVYSKCRPNNSYFSNQQTQKHLFLMIRRFSDNCERSRLKVVRRLRVHCMESCATDCSALHVIILWKWRSHLCCRSSPTCIEELYDHFIIWRETG